MEFDFELDSTSRRAATKEAHEKYRSVVRIVTTNDTASPAPPDSPKQTP